jgi:hypothetical protein
LQSAVSFAISSELPAATCLARAATAAVAAISEARSCARRADQGCDRSNQNEIFHNFLLLKIQ